MNKELLKSTLYKLLPAVAAYLVGSGLIDQATADKLPAAVDAVVILASFVPTLVRSIKNYGKKREAV